MTQLLALTLGAATWEAIGQLWRLPFFPPLSRVVQAGWELTASGEIMADLLPSVLSLVTGYGLAAGLGVATGTLMGRYRTVEHALDLYVSAMLAAPNLVFVPILFGVFGVGRSAQVAVVFLYAFFVVTATVSAAVRGQDDALVEMARVFGAGEGQVLWKVVLPGAMPLVMAGLRLGMVRAVKGMISGEMLVALTGLGASLRTYGSRFEADRMLAILLLVVALAGASAALVRRVDRRVTRWAAAPGEPGR